MGGPATIPEAWLAPTLAGASAALGVAAVGARRAGAAVRRAGAGGGSAGRRDARGDGAPIAVRRRREVVRRVGAAALLPFGRAAIRSGLVRRHPLAAKLAAAGDRPPPSPSPAAGLPAAGPPPAAGRAASVAADAWAEVEFLAGEKVALGLLAAGAAIAAGVAAVAPALGLLAFLGPDLVLARRARRRRARCDAEVPQLLDLLAAASSAGLAAPLALRRAAEALRGPLGEELRAVAVATDLGARWREELGRCAERVGSRDLRRAVALLARTERLGTSLARASVELADRVRAGRRAEAAERARRAPVLMLFPLVFLILPAFLLLTVVPVLLTTVRSIG